MRRSHRHLEAGLTLPLVAGAALAAAPAHAADQLVAFDETYVQELNGNVKGETYHHGIVPKPTEPASWTTPVNYAKGTAYLYMEVLEKPSKRNTILTVCFDGPKEGYGCFDTKSYTDVGTYESKVTMGGGGWYQYGKVNWGIRRDDYHLVIKDPALGGTQGGKPATDYVPTKLRVVLTVVPPGGTYTPPQPGGGGGSPDGGAPDAAGSTGGAGGGTGGTSGTGGATGGGGGASSTGGTGGSGTSTGGKSGGGTGGKAAGGTGGKDEPASGGDSGDGGSRSSGGCAVSAEGGGRGWLAIAGLVGALVLARRRSQRAR